MKMTKDKLETTIMQIHQRITNEKHFDFIVFWCVLLAYMAMVFTVQPSCVTGFVGAIWLHKSGVPPVLVPAPAHPRRNLIVCSSMFVSGSSAIFLVDVRASRALTKREQIVAYNICDTNSR